MMERAKQTGRGDYLQPLGVGVLAMIIASCLTGCRQDMARQPSFRPLRPSSFFADGRSARPLMFGTVPRGAKQVSGKRKMQEGDWARVAGVVAALPGGSVGGGAMMADWSSYVEELPLEISEALLDRGRDRFNIYCAVCHDRVGTGTGMIVQRGFTKPPSFHTDLARGFTLRGIDLPLRDAPVGYYFEVITHGHGAMPEHSAQVAPDDRWAIIAYIRALQLSQRATLADVRDEDERLRLISKKEQDGGR